MILSVNSATGEKYLVFFAYIFVCSFVLLNFKSTAGEVPGANVRLYAGRSCHDCDKIKNALKKYSVDYEYIDIDKMKGYERLVAEEKRLGRESDLLPVLVYGLNVVGGDNAIIEAAGKVAEWQKSNIDSDIGSGNIKIETDAALTSSSSQTTQQTQAIDATAEAEFRLSKINIVAIALAGLADGINPCVFATVIFLAGCLAKAGKERGGVILAGLSFSAGVFLTYILVGVGIFQALFALEGYKTVRVVFNYGVEGLLVVLGLAALVDAIHTWKTGGKPLFHMSDKLRQSSNKRIARGMHAKVLPLATFGIGASVSLVSLACTGQIYVPTIMYVMKTGASTSRAAGLFLLYNVMFILPLLIIVFLTDRGLQAESLWSFLKRHAAVSRFMAAGVFLSMFAMLRWM